MPKKIQKAFTMVELIFVIIIIGILSAVAIPKFSQTTELAYASKAESVVSTLRSAIATDRQKRILRGENPLNDITTTEAEALLDYGLDSNWVKKSDTTDTFTYTTPDGAASCDFKIDGGKLVKGTCEDATGLNHL